MFLGFMLAVLSVVGVSKKTTTLALLIPILVVGVPVFDTLFAMGRRFAKKVVVEKEWRPSALRAMFSADKSHIHHVLLDMGYTHRKTVFILYGMSIILALFAVVASIAANDRLHFGLIIAGAAVFVVVRQWGKFIALPGFGGGTKNGEGEK
jgi:UDP-GlcNAc:undecaprenyl-phosphate GlcNAc-1-phosphate transferase